MNRKLKQQRAAAYRQRKADKRRKVLKQRGKKSKAATRRELHNMARWVGSMAVAQAMWGE